MAKIKSPQDVYSLIKGEFVGKDVEQCYIITLSGQKVKSIHFISMGSEKSCMFPVKVIARHAIMDLATGIVVIHNHPSGDVNPSAADIQETQNLRNALKVFDTEIIDHVILGDDSFFSFAENQEFKI